MNCNHKVTNLRVSRTKNAKLLHMTDFGTYRIRCYDLLSKLATKASYKKYAGRIN